MRPNARIGIPEEEDEVLLEHELEEGTIDDETRELVIRACAGADEATARLHRICDRLEASAISEKTDEAAKP